MYKLAQIYPLKMFIDDTTHNSKVLAKSVISNYYNNEVSENIHFINKHLCCGVIN